MRVLAGCRCAQHFRRRVARKQFLYGCSPAGSPAVMELVYVNPVIFQGIQPVLCLHQSQHLECHIIHLYPFGNMSGNLCMDISTRSNYQLLLSRIIPHRCRNQQGFTATCSLDRRNFVDRLEGRAYFPVHFLVVRIEIQESWFVHSTKVRSVRQGHIIIFENLTAILKAGEVDQPVLMTSVLSAHALKFHKHLLNGRPIKRSGFIGTTNHNSRRLTVRREAQIKHILIRCYRVSQLTVTVHL